MPYAPGGFADVAARIVAQKLQERLGQQVIVENRSGGNGFIGTTAGAKAAPDGYTLLTAHTGEFAVSPAVFKDIPFELERDFESITMISIAPLLVAANAKGPIQSIPDLIAAAKAKPNTVGMGTPGTASINHLAGEWFADAAGIKLLHVPYKGGAPAGVAVAAGEVPMGVMAISSVMAQIQAGRVKPLAVTTAKRSAQFKDWPTLQEAGSIKDVDASIWTGLFAPKGTPKADPRQAACGDGRDPGDAGRAREIRPRRRRHRRHVVGGFRRHDQARGRRLQGDRPKGEHQAGVMRASLRASGGRTVRIRSPSDFWCGVLFIAMGIAFMVLARQYRFGTPARMGPGFFPTILGGILAALGLTLSIPALLRDGDPLPRLRLRPMVTILAAIVVFALLLQPLGIRAGGRRPDPDCRLCRPGIAAHRELSGLRSS